MRFRVVVGLGAGPRMTEAGRRLCVLFGNLCVSDGILDGLLVSSSRIAIAPPHWPLILALQPQVFACSTVRFAFIALLAPEAACETT